MHNLTELRWGHLVDGKHIWVWPKQDKGCWDWMNLEKDLPTQIMPYVDKTDVCITAGAHAGMYAFKYGNIFKKVFALEPHPVNFYCLCRNVTQENVIKIQAGLSDSRKMIGLQTLHEENSGGYFVTDGNLAMTMLLDDIPEAPDLIHLDVEGHEYEVLAGAQNILCEYSPTVVIETIPNYSTERAHKFLLNLNYNIVLKLKNDTIYKKAR